MKRTFRRGLATVLPIALTIAIVYWLAISLERVLGAIMRLVLPEGYYLPGSGLVVAIILVFIVGIVMRAWMVRKLMSFGESIIERIPLAKTVYAGLRDIIRYLEMAADERQMGKVVAVQIQDGHSVIGFVTSEELPFEDEGGEERVAVFIPMSYQIGGFTVCVERSRLRSIDIANEDAMRWVLTAGVSAGSDESGDDH